MVTNFPLYVGPFEFPAPLTRDSYAEFLNAELPNFLENIPFLSYAKGWFNTMAQWLCLQMNGGHFEHLL
jgi:hypothetical protein